jgi:hypothetical protein
VALSDQDVLDEIAVRLGTSPEWNGGDLLSWIAEMIALSGRPNPGVWARSRYPEQFRAATGRDVNPDWLA